jgi:hypothetical protein
MSSDRRSVRYERRTERRRMVALARHFRETEGLSIAQRLGRARSNRQPPLRSSQRLVLRVTRGIVLKIVGRGSAFALPRLIVLVRAMRRRARLAVTVTRALVHLAAVPDQNAGKPATAGRA